MASIFPSFQNSPRAIETRWNLCRHRQHQRQSWNEDLKTVRMVLGLSNERSDDSGEDARTYWRYRHDILWPWTSCLKAYLESSSSCSHHKRLRQQSLYRCRRKASAWKRTRSNFQGHNKVCRPILLEFLYAISTNKKDNLNSSLPLRKSRPKLDPLAIYNMGLWRHTQCCQ